VLFVTFVGPVFPLASLAEMQRGDPVVRDQALGADIHGY
jgi:hypothetical protein